MDILILLLITTIVYERIWWFIFIFGLYLIRLYKMKIINEYLITKKLFYKHHHRLQYD